MKGRNICAWVAVFALLLPGCGADETQTMEISAAGETVLPVTWEGSLSEECLVQRLEAEKTGAVYALYAIRTEEKATAVLRAELAGHTAEFVFPFPISGGDMPGAALFDLNGDGAEELLLDVPEGSGTGVNVHALYVITAQEEEGGCGALRLPEALFRRIGAELFGQQDGMILRISMGEQQCSVSLAEILPEGASAALDEVGSWASIDISGGEPVLRLGLFLSGGGVYGVGVGTVSARISLSGDVFTLSDITLAPL